MSEYTVNKVVDGDTFKVVDGWTWKQKAGDTIRPHGYNTPERGKAGYKETKQKLKRLILNKKVDVKDSKVVDVYGRLVADVYYEDKNLADYFQEYKT